MMRLIFIFLTIMTVLTMCTSQSPGIQAEGDCDWRTVYDQAIIVEAMDWDGKEYWEVDAFCERAQAYKSWSGDRVVETITETEDGWYRLKNNPFLIAEYRLVKEDSDYFRIVDGVLFSKDMTVLYRYPAMKEGLVYEIPETVTTIEDEAFMGTYYLRDIIIPDSVTNIYGSYVFYESCTEKIHFSRNVSNEFDVDCLGYLPYIKELIVAKNTTVAEAITKEIERGAFYEGVIRYCE